MRMHRSYNIIEGAVNRAVERLDEDATRAAHLADYPLAKAFNWGYARGIPTDDQLRTYRQKK